ncbi:hypothetical protein EF910_21580 [Streptomyces sp. WAC07149]|uniref:hypothetical protein n=1 Tax=Streptomyces sp. WAC07149 TaxID=2487425 RepID=UPI000F777E46|nr:hypothetical protein [Streptomyces sp. WAC07149]RST03169.1 hypothetical protein EF910_21580 [Streptomyces sp. WAC07149]
MSREWESLTESQRAFMINAFEIDILPGVWGDLAEEDKERPAAELAPILLDLVDRGWVEVRRVVPWVTPDGNPGFQPGGAVPREALPEVLADPAEWEYPEGAMDWIGTLTLTETPEGWRVNRISPGEEAG